MPEKGLKIAYMAYQGKIVDEQGKPVAGAKLQVIEPDQVTQTDLAEVTNELGAYMFPYPYDLTGFLIDVSAPGYSSQRLYNYFDSATGGNISNIVLIKKPFPWWVLIFVIPFLLKKK